MSRWLRENPRSFTVAMAGVGCIVWGLAADDGEALKVGLALLIGGPVAGVTKPKPKG